MWEKFRLLCVIFFWKKRKFLFWFQRQWSEGNYFIAFLWKISTFIKKSNVHTRTLCIRLHREILWKNIIKNNSFCFILSTNTKKNKSWIVIFKKLMLQQQKILWIYHHWFCLFIIYLKKEKIHLEFVQYDFNSIHQSFLFIQYFVGHCSGYECFFCMFVVCLWNEYKINWIMYKSIWMILNDNWFWMNSLRQWKEFSHIFEFCFFFQFPGMLWYIRK